MAATDTLVADALAAVAAVDDIAAEILFSAQYEALGPEAYRAPEWIQRWGGGLDPDCSKTEEWRSFTDAVCAEFPDDDAEATRWLLWLFAGCVSSRTHPEQAESIRATVAELVPPYLAAARARARTATA